MMVRWPLEPVLCFLEEFPMEVYAHVKIHWRCT